MLRLALAALLLAAMPAGAQTAGGETAGAPTAGGETAGGETGPAVDHPAIAARALDEYILPGFERLAAAAGALAAAAGTACAGDGPIDRAPVEEAYAAAFDAWIGVEHLRFGPLQEDNAGFAVAFWPDTKGSTPRTLEALVAGEDPVIDDPKAFAGVSVAARGLFALDYLLFDPAAAPVAAGTYRCRLVVAIAQDMAATAEKMLGRWQDPWAGMLTSAGAADNPVYLAPDEATRALYSALTEQLQADVDLRLGRPLGTFERPQPRRAEAWRSDRSLANVAASLAALRRYAAVVFGPAVGPDHAETVDAGFAGALGALDRVQSEPIDVAVSSMQGRVHVEALQSAVRRAQGEVAEHIGPPIGVTSGFNAMDGD